jgi:hypothetical protein
VDVQRPLPRILTPYCECGRDSFPRNVSEVGYAVTLRACSVTRYTSTLAPAVTVSSL